MSQCLLLFNSVQSIILGSILPLFVVLFYSILFYSVSMSSIVLFCSFYYTRIYSALICCFILFYSILCQCLLLFYSVHSIILGSILPWFVVLFYSILFYSVSMSSIVLFCSIPYFSVLYFSAPVYSIIMAAIINYDCSSYLSSLWWSLRAVYAVCQRRPPDGLTSRPGQCHILSARPWAEAQQKCWICSHRVWTSPWVQPEVTVDSRPTLCDSLQVVLK